METGILTLEQKEQIDGQYYNQYNVFHPILNCNNLWVIFKEEMDATTNPEYLWVKDLPLTEFCR